MRKFVLFGCLVFMIILTSCNFGTPEADISFQEQFEIDLSLIDAYLTENEIVAEIDESNSIRYVVHQEGTGASPTVYNIITVNYEGKLLDETIFDSNTSGFRTFLYELIPAWRYMVPKMKVGGEMTIYAPSGYCYGNQKIGTIPANSPLIFTIELISIE